MAEVRRARAMPSFARLRCRPSCAPGGDHHGRGRPRAARLRPLATKYADPEGVASLPEPPESGRDADGKQFARDWRAHLVETFDTDLDASVAPSETT